MCEYYDVDFSYFCIKFIASVLVLQGNQQIILGQKPTSAQKGNSFGMISLHENAGDSKTINFPQKTNNFTKNTVVKATQAKVEPADIQATTDSSVVVNQDSLGRKESVEILTPATKVTVEKVEIKTLEVPYPFHEATKTDTDFKIDMFEFGDSVDFSYQPLRAVQKEFVQEFEEKVLKINYNQINNTTNNWMFWLILGTLVIFGWMRLIYRKQLDLTLSSILHYNFAVKSIRNTSEYSNRFATVLQLIFSINIALFAYQVYDYYNPINIHGLKSALIVIGVTAGVAIMYGAKDLFLKTIGVIFSEINYVQEYLYNVHLFNKVLGIFLFPVVIAFAFVQPHIIHHNFIVFGGFALILAFFILRIVRGIQISYKANVSILYMFLYFCTLEILPVLLLLKTGKLIISVLNF